MSNKVIPVLRIFDYAKAVGFYTLLSEKKYKYNRPGLEHTPWNAITMKVTDPFGNRVLFSEKEE